MMRQKKPDLKEFEVRLSKPFALFRAESRLNRRLSTRPSLKTLRAATNRSRLVTSGHYLQLGPEAIKHWEPEREQPGRRERPGQREQPVQREQPG
jgi:hypothetical protein